MKENKEKTIVAYRLRQGVFLQKLISQENIFIVSKRTI